MIKIFRIKGTFIDEDKFEMFIYDRWGNLFFETDDINTQWDGTANGETEIVKQDVYVYLIICICVLFFILKIYL